MVPNHFVGSAGAIGHKEAMVGIEDAGGIPFAFANGTVVIQQLA
jgi:hypothetical protein